MRTRGFWRKALAALGCSLAFCGNAHALTQTLSPASCSSVGGIGSVAWSNPGNALASDNAYADASVNATVTNYLSCTNYGFSIPTGARIDGITVNVERASSRTSNGGAMDAAMRLVKGGVIGATDRSTATVYTTTDTIEAHGGTTDLWGDTWTAADINASDFGAAFAATKPNSHGPAHDVRIDWIEISVDYTPAPWVVSIVRLDPDPTAASSVRWTVTFNESVTGVDASDFALAAGGGVAGASITSVTGSGLTYTVTASTGSGNGTLGLNLVDDDSIVNAAAVPLGGSGVGNGDFTGEVYTVDHPVVVSAFNAVEPGADPVAGRIYTKIAGQAIAVDLVALDASNALATTFTGTVAVELVDNTSGGACDALPVIKTLANETFTAADAGRHPLSAGQSEADAWRNVLFRINYPAASPTVTSCSGDAFANRPAQLAGLVASDQDRLSAGTARTLNSTASPGSGTVHNAGRPFRIDATAQNGAATPATTPRYAPDPGEPVALLSQCGAGVPPACLPAASLGTLTVGSWSAAAGTITTASASYNDVGSFALSLEDRSFAAVDAGDGTPTSVRYIPSAAAVTVGRFVPDHFTLETGSAITPRTDIAACAASSFTYMDERMDLVFTLTAREAGGAATAHYDSAAGLAALALNTAASYGFGAVDSAAPTPLSARLDTSLVGGVAASWNAGVAAVSVPIAIARAAAPDGPFASLGIGIAPSDADGVTLDASALDLDADGDGTPERAKIGASTAVRFGRLRLQNAVGSEKLDLPIPLDVQYWNGSGFTRNSADGCTSLAAADLSLGSYQGGITAANLGATHISLGGAFSSGVGSLTLTAPSPTPASAGSAVLTVDLGAEAKSYLEGNWGVPTYTANPSANAAFGFFGSQPSQFIYFRENY